jgi:hypothetical protein
MCYSTAIHHYPSTFLIACNYKMANERITVVGATLGNSVYTLEIIVAIITDVGKIYILL